MASTKQFNGGISRRGFLKAATGLVAHASVMGVGMPSWQDTAVPAKVVVPPSLMLHSIDGQVDFLPNLLRMLNDHGFTSLTYQQWYRGVLENQIPSKPIIISIDDISMAQHACAHFSTFVQMKDWIQEAGMTAVFAVITEPVINGHPQREQDDERWDIVRDWIDEGFELVTHTSYHSNFNAMDSGPRTDFTVVDYEAEIIKSSHLIEEKLAQRNLNYPVQTFITPYGSGYSYKQTPSQIHSGILQACSRTNINLVVGIAQGRAPISTHALKYPQAPTYVGRIPPAYLVDQFGDSRPSADLTLTWLNNWHESNQSYQLALDSRSVL